ncbi:hypothetical protein [Brevundimonas sp. A19_0]|uniref:hypothetical protein n=1 Tax=Brevundimonas sp. A19_0 TaxID=2821087 RepID=UPI001FD85F70|nr:hypothetical protein [Brevundimonas sp. A19_0]
MAADAQFELAQAIQRHELDDLDQLSQLAPQVFAGVALDRQVQGLRHAAVAFRGAGVQLHHDRGGRGGDQSLELRPARLQRRRAGLQLVHGDHLLHEHHLGPLQLATDLGQFALGRGSRGESFQAAGGLLLVEDPDGAGNRFGRQQMAADAGENPVLDRAGGDDLVVLASPALAGGAAGVLAAVQRHAGSAQAALHQAGQQAFGLTGVGRRLVGQGRLARLHRLPGLVVDDAQVRHGFAQPVFGRVQDRGATAGVGVLAIAAAVEHAHADVEFLVQDAVLGPAVAVDGRRRPFAATWARLILRVQHVGDHAGRNAVGIGLVDSADDPGLMVVDLQHALLGGPVAVAETAAGEAGLHPADQPAPRLATEFGQEQLVHGAGQAHVQFADLPLGQGLQPDAVEGQALIDMRRTLLIARQAVQSLGDDEVDLSALGRSHHGADARAIGHGRSGDTLVGKVDELYVRPIRELALDRGQLVGRGAVVLKVRGSAGVECDFHVGAI